MQLRNLMGACVAAVALATAASASATVTQLTFAAPGAAQPQVYFNGYVPGTTTVDPRLSATLDLSLTSVSAGGYQWNFSYNLANTSEVASRVSVVGWDIAPDFLGAIGLGGLFSTAASGNMASLGSMDLCLKSGGGANCAGGGNGGLAMGQSGSGVFSLTFLDHTTTYITVHTPRYNTKGKLIGYTDSQIPQITNVAAPTSVAFNNFGLHIQSLDGGGSTVGVPGTPPPPVFVDDDSVVGDIRNAVPEPATWTMLILGFGGIGAMMRRRRVAFA